MTAAGRVRAFDNTPAVNAGMFRSGLVQQRSP
jgi:hypothetical protein